ncbi:hypothetical protein [Azospirillum rugosum]|uniref:hypothetical protein n=1 Tax=Azospirillum rugosum TaxID=416170 RepID=UPI00361699D2
MTEPTHTDTPRIEIRHRSQSNQNEVLKLVGRFEVGPTATHRAAVALHSNLEEGGEGNIRAVLIDSGGELDITVLLAILARDVEIGETTAQSATWSHTAEGLRAAYARHVEVAQAAMDEIMEYHRQHDAARPMPRVEFRDGLVNAELAVGSTTTAKILAHLEGLRDSISSGGTRVFLVDEVGEADVANALLDLADTVRSGGCTVESASWAHTAQGLRQRATLSDA